MTEIILNVQRHGTLPGTVGWLADKLKDAVIRIRATRAGKPGVWLVARGRDTEETHLLALYTGEYDPYEEPGYWHWPFPDPGSEHEAFGVPLTDAARRKLTELAAEAEGLLQCELENTVGLSISIDPTCDECGR